MTFKVVITDVDFLDIAPQINVLSKVPAEVVRAYCRSPEEVLSVGKNADGLLVQYAPVTRSVIQGLERCKVIARYGVGVDSIDIAAATTAGIPVCNVRNYCVDEVTEHTLAMILACGRRLLQLDSWVRQRRWSALTSGAETERLSGQRLGVVGFGAIGKSVAAKARALGFNVTVFSRSLNHADAADAGVEWAPDLGSLLRTSDFVSLHLPLAPETRHLLAKAEFGQMKRSAYLINTSRGALVDEEALCAALRNGDIAGAGLDVLEQEPPRPDNPLLAFGNVILSPHVAYHSRTSVWDLQTKAAEAVAAVLLGQRPRSVVNPEVLPGGGDAAA